MLGASLDIGRINFQRDSHKGSSYSRLTGQDFKKANIRSEKTFISFECSVSNCLTQIAFVYDSGKSNLLVFVRDLYDWSFTFPKARIGTFTLRLKTTQLMSWVVKTDGFLLLLLISGLFQRMLEAYDRKAILATDGRDFSLAWSARVKPSAELEPLENDSEVEDQLTTNRVLSIRARCSDDEYHEAFFINCYTRH
ncbi:hypothetical protein POM88_042042 [Heracleum sosnowskyi]|uniref:Uncharacterized protein n=1 Tax=Heracleum sosnowskyi TaxID=360622 RepID=A0AAD8MAA9_9APIA|nr:hypothetical protein POM88_042042 [Heracleum sosnowskyi]